MTTINRTMLVGVGGVGSALLQPLAALLACEDSKNLVIVDGDKYEEKNLRNQCITPDDVGMNKAEWAAEMVEGLCPDVDAWDEYISGPNAIKSWLVNAVAEQQKLRDAKKFGGVAVIIIPVDNDHCRKYIYEACAEMPKVNVLVIDPSNGAGDDADEVDVVTYLRVYDPESKKSIETWASPLVKYAQLQEPKGLPAHVGCGLKAESQPQLRTSNMLAATLTYDCLERFLKERGMPEGYKYDDKHGLRTVGKVLPTAKALEEAAQEVTV